MRWSDFNGLTLMVSLSNHGQHPSTGSSFDKLRMRGSVINALVLMVSLSNHELVAVRRAHREAMGRIVFQQPARDNKLLVRPIRGIS
jgi:hypothetical protein